MIGLKVTLRHDSFAEEIAQEHAIAKDTKRFIDWRVDHRCGTDSGSKQSMRMRALITGSLRRHTRGV